MKCWSRIMTLLGLLIQAIEYPVLLCYTRQFYMWKMGRAIHSNINVFAGLWKREAGSINKNNAVEHTALHFPKQDSRDNQMHIALQQIKSLSNTNTLLHSSLFHNPITFPFKYMYPSAPPVNTSQDGAAHIRRRTLLSGCSERIISPTQLANQCSPPSLCIAPISSVFVSWFSLQNVCLQMNKCP